MYDYCTMHEQKDKGTSETELKIIGLPIFTALNPLYIKHGHLILVCYSVMHVQYLHIPPLNNQFILQLKQWEQHRLFAHLDYLLSHKAGAGSLKCEMCKLSEPMSDVCSVLNPYNSIHSAHFHVDHFSAHLKSLYFLVFYFRISGTFSPDYCVAHLDFFCTFFPI